MEQAREMYAVADYRRAAESYRRAIENNPDDALAHEGLARCMAQLREFGIARSEAARALELQADLPISHLILSGILALEKHYDQSESEARRALALDPTIWEAYGALGEALSAQGKTEEGRSIYEKGIEVEPNSWKNRLNFSSMLYRRRLYSDSMREATKAFRLHPSPQTAYWLHQVILHSHPVLIFGILAAAFVATLLLPRVPSFGLRLLLVGYLLASEFGEIRYGRRSIGWIGLVIVAILGVIWLFSVPSR